MVKQPQTTQDSESPASLEELKGLAGQYPTLEYMILNKIPLTRENYLDLDWPDRKPEDESDAEYQASLPIPFRQRLM